MYTDRSPWPRFAALIILFLTAATPGHSQARSNPTTAEPATPTPQPIVLSPFEVSSATERGYQSTAVLQGGRGQIDLADLAGQVSVFTKDFLADIGATSIDEAYLFSATTQTYFDNVDGGAGGARGTNLSPRAGTTGDAINSRGLGTLDQTRNFFRTAIDPDTYNMERFSLISGANAVQFGLGGPAGTSESTSARANLSQNRQRTKLRTDSYGSERYELDISQVIFKDRLAVRGIVLKENREYFLRPGYEENRRGFATATYQPFKHTVLRVEGEYAYRRDCRQATIMARDVGYMSWLAGQQAGSPLVYNNRAATAATAGRPAAPNFTRPDGSSINYAFGTNPALYIWPQNSVPEFSFLQDVRNTVAPPVAAGGGQTQSLIVPDYPWNVAPAGFARFNRRRSRNMQATLEQRLGPATFLELGYSWEFYRNHSSQLMAGNFHNVLVDINRFLPDGVTPNPLYGRAFTESSGASGQGSWTDNRIIQYRATLTHNRDFTRSAGFARHLGGHRLALFASYDDSSLYNLGNNQFMIIGKPSFLSPAARENPLDSSRRFMMRFYLPPIGSTNDPFAYAMPDMSAQGDLMGVMAFKTASGEVFQVTEFGNPAGFVGANPTASHVQRASAAASTSSSFFANNLIVNLGVRHDRVRNSDFAAFIPILAETPFTAANPTGTGLKAYSDFREEVPADVWTPHRAATRVNYGFVVRPPRLGKWISFGYDYSRNASLAEVAVVRDIDGKEVEPDYGESHEYSLRFRLLGDRLNIKVNYYNALNRNTTLADSNLRRNLIDFERQLFVNDPTYSINPLLTQELNLQPAHFRLPGDLNSKGIEVDLTFNPSPHWRIFWNLGRIDTKIDDISAQPWWDYLDQKLEVWKAYKGNWATATYISNQTVQSAWEALIDTPLDTIQASLGNPGGNSQTWRSSLVATRSFSTGWLKGASASANFRYRGPRLVGFPNRVDDKGVVRVDRDNPFKSDDFILTGLMANYRFRGFGHTLWRVQVNANNIFNSHRLYLTRTYTNGAARDYGRQPGREFIASVDIEH